MEKDCPATSSAPVPAYRVGIIVLAAGSSSRLGEPKQLLQYQGETLLRRSVRRATESGCKPVIVVLGSEYERLRDEASFGEASLAVNPDWATGMGRSIVVGVEAALKANTELDAVMITLCDQPLVTPDHLRALVDAFRSSDCSVVATEYDYKRGVPALFSRSRMPELLGLVGASGAGGIISLKPEEVKGVPCPAACHDVDIRDDYRKLLDHKDLSSEHPRVTLNG